MTEVHVDPTHTISKASPLTQTVESDTVKVVCRVRPFVAREMQLHAKLNEGKPQWEQQPLRSIIEFHGKECVFLDSSGEDWIEKERFHFDFCYWSIPENQQEMEDAPYASQEKIFNDVGKTLLKHSWHGYNCCLFAYGQTGSGKTYSMMGPEGSAEDPGFIPRLCKQMFLDLERLTVEAQKNSETCITMYRVEVCYLELYNEQAKDLLWSLSPLSAEAKAKINPENLKIRNNPAQGTFVENLTMVDVESWQRCIELINKGNSSRSVAATKMNERSSRSHSIFKIIVTQITQTVPKKQFEKPVQSTREACINLVDLAGSERVRKSGATGDRFIEAANINKSLLTLKRVIDTLVDNATQRKKNIPPYRDSNLTALLKDSLGGNSKTYMLVCVSPHNDNAEESLLALRYASRARQIVNFVRINEDAASRRLLELEEELDRMRNELNTANNPELVEQLKAQIGEYEYGIQTMQEEMTLQQERIQQFKEAKERENKARHAMAFFNLHKLAQARFKKDEAVEEQNRLARQLSQVNNEKRNLAQRHQEAEKERERLRSSIDAYKMSSNQLDQEIDYWRARNQTLELYKAELQRNIEEQERDIHRRKEEKYARLFRTKFESHKIRNEFSNKLQEQTLRHKAELDAIYTDSQRKYGALVRTCIEKEEELEAELRNLQEEQARLEQELRGLKTDRTEEVAALEREVTHLTKERTMKQDDHQRFLDHSIEEWNRKYNTMVREMQVEQEKLAEQWERREHDDVKAEEEKFNQSRERFQSAMEQEKRSWDALAQQTDEEWQYKYESLQREWEVRLQEKSQRNQMLKKELRSVEEKELKYSALLHRVAAVLETANQDGPEDYLRLVRLLRTFQEEYTLNQPSKYKLQQLLRGENLKFRCQKAPQIGVPEDGTGVGTSTMNPASVGKSTLTPIARKGSSRLRGYSPKRC